MKQINTLIICFLAFFSFKTHAQNPNVIVVIADDMGWSQISTGLTNIDNPSDFYETPVLATLAAEGIAFPHAYVNGANCAPARAALMSGQYAARPTNNIFNVYDLNRGNDESLLVGVTMGLSGTEVDEIPASAITIAETLKTAGYTTAHFGKFHVGEDESTNTSNNAATDQGFDYNYGGGTKGTPGSYFATQSGGTWTFHNNIGTELDVYAAPYTLAESEALSVNGDDALEGTAKHVTDAMVDAAIDFMDTTNGNNAPFFMHYSNYAVHTPTDETNARPDLYAKYEAKNTATPSTMGHAYSGMGAILEGMDQSIGRLINYLKTTDDPRNSGHKLSENTLVYFISDNGGAVNTEENGPLRGIKGQYYEGGIRSATIVWSEASWLANKGTVNNTPVIGFDIYPTFVEAAGGTLPTGYDIDGVSLWQLLTNGTALTREALFWHFPGYLIDEDRDQRPVTVIRKGNYKLIYNYETADYELYNLITDMGESTNLLPSSDQAIIDTANNMIADMQTHLTEVSAPLPTYRSSGATVTGPDLVNALASNSTSGCQSASGYEAYWDFDSANTNITDDVSGNSHNAVEVIGEITGDTSDFKEGDQSAVFNGSSNVKYAPGASGNFMLNALTERSVMVWIKPTSLSGIQNIFDEGANLAGITIRLNGSNIECIVRSTETTSNTISSAYPSDGDWHHIALVYDGANLIQKLYIDGVEVASVAAVASVPRRTGKGGIGGKISGRDSFGNNLDANFIGKMDAFVVYDGVLTATQISNSSCSETLNIQEKSLTGLSIYPNPLKNKLNISFNATSENVVIELYSLLGHIVFLEKYNNIKSIEIPLETLNKGLYFIKISLGNKTITKKLVKN